MSVSRQDEWLQAVQKVSLTPLFVSREFLDKSEYNPGKLKLFQPSKGPWDHRSVCVNEVVFETDSTYAHNVKFKEDIEQALRDEKIPYYTWFSGNKSFHIHIFFNQVTFKHPQAKKLAQQAIELGFGYKEIRLWVLRRICRLAGITDDRIANGGIIDTSPIAFNDGSGHPIRAEGGRKQEYDAKLLEAKYCHYKTFIEKGEDVKKKPIVTNIDSVRFPFMLETFEIDDLDLVPLLEEYIKKASGVEKADMSNFKAEYLNLHGVTKLIDGAPIGKRSEAARVIAIAAALDKAPREHALQVMTQFVHNCPQSEPFTVDEAMGWYDWVVGQPFQFWNCSLLKNLDVHDDRYCGFCSSQRKEAIQLLSEKDILKSVEKTISQMVAGELKLAMSEYILFNSRHFPTDKEWKLPNDPEPIAAIIAADSSSGKSFVTKQVLKLFPEDAVIVRSRITKSVLNYLVEQNYTGKIIFIEELQGMDESSNQLRLWISEGKLRLETTEDVMLADGTTQKMAVIRETKGQPVFFTTTAQDVVDRELLNRCWILTTDLSSEQTRKILDMQDRLERGEFPKGLDQQIRRLQDMQRDIKPYHFLAPFTNRDVMSIPFDDIRVRRDYKKLLTMVKCVGLLYQRQRIILQDETGNQFVLCSFQDWHNAITYVDDQMEATFNGLSSEQREVFHKLRDTYGGTVIPGDQRTFETSDVQDLTSKHYLKCLSIMKALENLGYVHTTRGENGRFVYALSNKQVRDLRLPRFDDLKVLFSFEAWLRENVPSRYKIVDVESGKVFENIDEAEYLKKELVAKAYNLWQKNSIEFTEVSPSQGTNHGNSNLYTQEAMGELTNPAHPPKNYNLASGDNGSATPSNPQTPDYDKTVLRRAQQNEAQKQEMQTPENTLKKNDNAEFAAKDKICILSKKTVLEAIQNSTKNPVPYEDIEAQFEDKKELFKLIEQLKKEGEIFETKPGKLIIL